MSFVPPEPEQLIDPSSSFIFCSNPQRYLLRCDKERNSIVSFVGMIAPQEWVLMDNADSIHRSREIVKMEWFGHYGDGTFSSGTSVQIR